MQQWESDLAQRLRRIAPPIETTHLMCEKVWDHPLSRNGKVNREVCHALNLMDLGAELKKIWRRLDDYVTVDSQDEMDKIENEACHMANRMKAAQIRLAEAVYKREWSEEGPLSPSTCLEHEVEDCRDADLSIRMSTAMARCRA